MSDDMNGKEIETTEHHFVLFDTLGEGAMGEVVLARDEDLLRKVAIKKIKHQVSQNQFLLDSFITEAQITAQLEHPCIIPIYGLEVNQEGHMAYSMKRIAGQTLTELIQSAQQQYDQTGKVNEQHNLNAFLEHFLKVADAVEYAHQKGIIHRDLKPDNIMIGQYNEVYILDWGIARPMSQVEQSIEELVTVEKNAEDFNLFEGSDVYGTPCYMSPEQAAGGNEFLNGQSDLYSLGLILFELVSLKQAYSAEEDFNQTIDNSVDGKRNQLVPYHTNLVIPRELAAVIDKATVRTRRERYGSVKEMADEVRRYLRGEAVLAQPDTPVQQLQRWISQNKEKTLMLILSITLLSSLIIGWSFYKRYSDNLKAQHREAIQAQFLNLMRDKSQSINAQFLEIAALTQEYAAGVEQLLETNPVKKSEFYTFKMAQEGRRPPDSMKSKLYSSPVSAHHFVFKIAPGVEQKNVEPLLNKLAPYGPTMKQLLLLSHGDPYLDPESKEANDLLFNKGILVVDTFGGFEAGIGFSYPMSIINLDYDPRQRPWYKTTKNTRGYRWGQPYLDSTGLGWMFPCTKAVYNRRRQFKGVVGMDIKLPLISQMMKFQNKAFIKDVYLLNQKGQVLIQGSVKAKEYKAGTLLNKIEKLKTFPQTEVVKAIQAKAPSGYIQTSGANKTVYAFNHLSSNQWYYLVEVDSKQLFEGQK